MNTLRLQFSSLSRPHQELIRRMQDLNHGAIEHLPIVAGEPSFDEGTRVVRQIKFSGTNCPRHERDLADFALPAQMAELVDLFYAVGDGVVERLEVKHGLPFQMHLAQ